MQIESPREDPAEDPRHWRREARRLLLSLLFGLVGFAFSLEACLSGSWGPVRTVAFAVFNLVFIPLVIVLVVRTANEWRQERRGA